MAELIIDASDAIVGRLAAYAAKQAMLGATISVINAEKAVVSGGVRTTIMQAKHQKGMGVPRKGPYHSRLPDRFVRRIVRGMLPYKTPRGRAAYARTLCYIGVPTQFQGKPSSRVPGAEASKLPNLKRVTIGRLCAEFGGKRYEG
jgi:large subunit ribosomal protein L13